MHLPHHSAAILLGTLFAYPFHSQLRETFGIVPAPWLLSSDRSALNSAAKIIHHLFFPQPEEIASFLANRPNIPAITDRIAAFPYEPWHLEDWYPTSPGFSLFLLLTIDFGKIPSGLYGTLNHRVKNSCPPFVTGNKAPAEPSQASRFLYFLLLDGPPDSAAEPTTLADTVFASPATHPIETLLRQRAYAKAALRRAISIERELATKTWITFRQRIQLAIAYAYYTKADEILSEHPEDHELLLESITAPRAFDAPENLCV